MDRIKKGATELINEKWMEIVQKIIQAAEKEDNHHIQTFKSLISSTELDDGKHLQCYRLLYLKNLQSNSRIFLSLCCYSPVLYAT